MYKLKEKRLYEYIFLAGFFIHAKTREILNKLTAKEKGCQYQVKLVK